MTLIQTWRVTRGRYRTALRLAGCLLVVGLAGPTVRAAADGFASSVVIGDLLDVVARLLQAPVTPIIAGGLLVMAFAIRTHPAANIKHTAMLATTPWHPGQPLPLGHVSVTSPFVLAPTIAIGVLWLVGIPGTQWLACGASVGYVLFGVIVAIMAGSHALTWTLLLLLVALPPALAVERPSLAAAALAVAGVLTSVAQQLSLMKALRDGAFDLRQLSSQKRSNLGWMQNLSLEPAPQRRTSEAMGSLTLGALVASVTFTAHGFRGRSFRDALTVLTILVAGAALAATFHAAAPSFGVIARVLTGRWFVPRMDRVLLCPAMLVLWLIAIRTFPWPRHSPWNPLFGGVFVAACILTALWVAPSRLAWQATGATRIRVTPTANQKQQEAILRRTVGT